MGSNPRPTKSSSAGPRPTPKKRSSAEPPSHHWIRLPSDWPDLVYTKSSSAGPRSLPNHQSKTWPPSHQMYHNGWPRHTKSSSAGPRHTKSSSAGPKNVTPQIIHRLALYQGHISNLVQVPSLSACPNVTRQRSHQNVRRMSPRGTPNHHLAGPVTP